MNKPLNMIKKDQENFCYSTKCWICKKSYEKGDVKVKDHDHINKKYRGFAQQVCNLNLSLGKISLMCFIICKIIIHILPQKKLKNMILK